MASIMESSTPWEIELTPYTTWHRLTQLYRVDFEREIREFLSNLYIGEGLFLCNENAPRMHVRVECDSGSLSFPVFKQALWKKCLFFILLSQPLDIDNQSGKKLTTYNTYEEEQWKSTIPLHYKSNVDSLIATCVFLKNQEITHEYVGKDRIKFNCNGIRIHISIHTKNNTISCCVAVSVKYS